MRSSRWGALLMAVSLSLLACEEGMAESPKKQEEQPTNVLPAAAVADCKNPSYEELEQLAFQWGKTPTGEPAGVEVVRRTPGKNQNATLKEECPQVYSWCPADNVLIIRYKQPVKLWHVERSVKFLEEMMWYAKKNASSVYTKQETVEVFALPDCKGWPVDGDKFGQPNPIPTPPACLPTTCADGVYAPGVVIQYVGAVVIPAGVEMAFGYVGPNMWGPGGELQWYVTNLNGQKIENLPPERWPGD